MTKFKVAWVNILDAGTHVFNSGTSCIHLLAQWL